MTYKLYPLRKARHTENFLNEAPTDRRAREGSPEMMWQAKQLEKKPRREKSRKGQTFDTSSAR